MISMLSVVEWGMDHYCMEEGRRPIRIDDSAVKIRVTVLRLIRLTDLPRPY
jgi:hypothetical protein